MSKTTREKKRKSMTGRIRTPEHIENHRAAMRKPETIAKRVNAITGQTRDATQLETMRLAQNRPEVKAKKSAALIGRPKSTEELENIRAGAVTGWETRRRNAAAKVAMKNGDSQQT